MPAHIKAQLVRSLLQRKEQFHAGRLQALEIGTALMTEVYPWPRNHGGAFPLRWSTVISVIRRRRIVQVNRQFQRNICSPLGKQLEKGLEANGCQFHGRVAIFADWQWQRRYSVRLILPRFPFADRSKRGSERQTHQNIRALGNR